MSTKESALPTGATLAQAIEAVDAATDAYPAYYYRAVWTHTPLT